MSKAGITIEGIDAYMDKLTKSPDRLIEHIRQQAMQDAEVLAGEQRLNCSAVIGMLRESIETFCQREGDVVEAGTRIRNENAAFAELGAGPRKADMPDNGVNNTSAQPATPFMYPAMKKMEETIKLHFRSAVKEVLR